MTHSAGQPSRAATNLLLSERATRLRRAGSFLGRGFLLLVTAASAFAVLFIFIFIIKESMPFFSKGTGGLTFNWAHFRQFFTGLGWYPTHEPAEFGAVAIFFGSAMVTLGAVIVAVPLGILGAICLSDILPFGVRQVVKPVTEVLAAIPSVAYGFFALVVFAPMLQERGGTVLAAAVWMVGLPMGGVLVFVCADLAARRFPESSRSRAQLIVLGAAGAALLYGLARLGGHLSALRVVSGTDALNASIILGIMALPTIVSVSEDALQAAGRELREGSYALGATRVETIFHVIVPAAAGGILTAVILGVMRAAGETMVVWMASGNAAHIPTPPYNVLQPICTLTATIAGEMGEAPVNSDHHQALFSMALCLLIFSFAANVATEWISRRARRKLG
jgi:phosphate transport system permease protein